MVDYGVMDNEAASMSGILHRNLYIIYILAGNMVLSIVFSEGVVDSILLMDSKWQII